jgi:acetyl-CoA C-acetyltransferase
VIPVLDQNGLTILDHEETIREDASLEGLAKLSPSFEMMGEFGFDAVAQLKYTSVENQPRAYTGQLIRHRRRRCTDPRWF